MSAASKQYQYDTPTLTYYPKQGQIVCDGIDDVVASMVESDFGHHLVARFNSHDALVAALRYALKTMELERESKLLLADGVGICGPAIAMAQTALAGLEPRKPIPTALTIHDRNALLHNQLARAKKDESAISGEELDAWVCHDCGGEKRYERYHAVTHQLGTDMLPQWTECETCKGIGYCGPDAEPAALAAAGAS